ncbi:IclR family transcriptional regulator [Kocuria sp.]|uniref:IclR family transcriptional regulator n=1 Tax=Kocuria sp. TaxID=1871328 RepID=UPI0026DF5E01|nr:helix-turn-helix domain-containing protein [Kocuria sp.]MDO5619781.1 helix-turn-helix domain-containing protein [Kocuria sp.]
MVERQTAGAAKSVVGSQTLSRGIQILEVLATAGAPLGIDDVAAHLGVHRSVVYRLIRTLEGHGLVQRTPGGALGLGLGLAALAAGVEVDLRAVAIPVLRTSAQALGLTCFVALQDGDEAVTIASVEPPRAVAVVAQRPGTRHSITRGATGRVILSQLAEKDWPSELAGNSSLREQVHQVAQRGWAETSDEVIAGLHAVAVPLRLPDGRTGAVASLSVGTDQRTEVRVEVLRAAAGALMESL